MTYVQWSNAARPGTRLRAYTLGTGPMVPNEPATENGSRLIQSRPWNPDADPEAARRKSPSMVSEWMAREKQLEMVLSYLAGPGWGPELTLYDPESNRFGAFYGFRAHGPENTLLWRRTNSPDAYIVDS